MRQIDGYLLWIGNARDARDIRSVLLTGIEAVVDLAMDEPPLSPTRELVYLRFPLMDGGENSIRVVRAAVRAVQGLIRDEMPTLVACGAGMSRSPAITAAALATINGCGLDAMLKRLQRGVPTDVSPGLWATVIDAVGVAGERLDS